MHQYYVSLSCNYESIRNKILVAPLVPKVALLNLIGCVHFTPAMIPYSTFPYHQTYGNPGIYN